MMYGSHRRTVLGDFLIFLLIFGVVCFFYFLLRILKKTIQIWVFVVRPSKIGPQHCKKKLNTDLRYRGVQADRINGPRGDE